MLLQPVSVCQKAVIAVRVSGGHLCEAEAPTEPAGETAARRAAIRSSFKGITDSFAPSAQNDKPFSYFNHRKIRGNPFSFLKNTYLHRLRGA